MSVLTRLIRRLYRRNWESPDRVDPIVPKTTHADVNEGESVRDAYETLVAGGVKGKIVLGIYGKAGPVSLGHAYSTGSDDLFRNPSGIDVAFVGMTPDAEVGPLFLGNSDPAKFDPVIAAEFYNIGIRGRVDSFAVRQQGYVGSIVFDNFWILPHPDMDSMYTSGLHLHTDWESLTLKRYQARGLSLREHCFYIKHGGNVQLLDNELWGGNRTGFQIRPHESPPKSPKPHGSVVIDGNWSNDFGWNHEIGDGGQWITVWTSLEYPVRISNNRCQNARFGCLGILRQTPSQLPYVTKANWSHTNVYVYGNTMDNVGSRTNAEIVDVRRLHIGHGNKFTSTSRAMAFGSQFSQDYSSARPPKRIFWYGVAPDWDVWNYKEGKYVAY